MQVDADGKNREVLKLASLVELWIRGVHWLLGIWPSLFWNLSTLILRTIYVLHFITGVQETGVATR